MISEILSKALMLADAPRMRLNACPIKIGTTAARAAFDTAPPIKMIPSGQYRSVCETSHLLGPLLFTEYSSGRVNSADIDVVDMECVGPLAGIIPAKIKMLLPLQMDRIPQKNG